MNPWVGILWLIVLLFGNAFFVAAEFAVMTARRSQIEPLADAGSKRAKVTLGAMENVSLMLACSQLGITVCSLLILNVSEPAIHHLLAAPLHAVGVADNVASPVAFVITLALVTFLHVTFGEMVPKNMSVSAADKAALLLAPPLVLISKVVRPVIVALNWTANHIVRLFGIVPQDEVSSSFTLEEVQSIVQESTRTGLVDDQTGLITGALEFSSQTARGIMVPLTDLVTLPAAATPVDFEHKVGKTGFSRFVFTDAEGALLGYLHLKDVLRIPVERYQMPIGEARVRSMVNLQSNEEIEDVLATMQRTGSHMARVIDEHEQTMGVLFLEDVIEQLVGEIRDATQTHIQERRKA
ncbi:hemolysin family protein [Arthrobacter antibioticus]|uniref:hemolysin family protein n=1 Tax=Arthrobacter sp. H35-MC1 TaxID=3046203 RepID=UPI0024BA05B8|nr:hemolysin family protein [Arthrobacter sp. H35-MC1]MDJ0316418.1 hemolysin family protein [Arthrobacter sp. H35-MC1]